MRVVGRGGARHSAMPLLLLVVVQDDRRRLVDELGMLVRAAATLIATGPNIPVWIVFIMKYIRLMVIGGDGYSYSTVSLNWPPGLTGKWL